MKVIKHPAADHLLGAPGCDVLPVQIYRHADGRVAAQVSRWQPTTDEIAAINAGQAIELYIFAPAHPPVQIEVARHCTVGVLPSGVQ